MKNSDILKNDSNDNKTIENIMSELIKINKRINDSNLQMMKKEDDIKNIINEKDNIIKDMEKKLSEQEKIIKKNINEISNLHLKIEEISNKLINIQNENKNEIIKLSDKINVEKKNLINEVDNKYKEMQVVNKSMYDKLNVNIMNLQKPYRVIVLGETGVGKSQFCNFIRRDLTNSINKVSDSVISTTYNFNLNNFIRNQIKFEFIDTPGFDDSYSNKDYFKGLFNYLKSLGKLEYIILMFNFYNIRISNNQKEFIETLVRLFSPREFYNHACIVFTRSPNRKRKREIERHENFKKVFNNILENILNIKEINNINFFYIDTDIDDDESDENQEKVDIILKHIKENADKYNSIKTKNLNFNG